MKHVKKLIVYIIALFVFSGVFIVLEGNDNELEYDFEIYFFKAGSADAIILSKEDKHLMIDTGEESLTNEILDYFKKNNITKLDYLILTHFDKDHIGSAANIINNIDVDIIYESNYPKESEYYLNYLNAINNKSLNHETITGNKTIPFSNINININGPDKVYEINKSNNSSLIIEANYNNKNFLFLGDIQNERIEDYISSNETKYDFIKIPYHGKYLEKLEPLLNNINPRYGVITCSNNKGCEKETLKLLKEHNIRYYLTKNGPITIKSNGEIIEIKQE